MSSFVFIQKQFDPRHNKRTDSLNYIHPLTEEKTQRNEK